MLSTNQITVHILYKRSIIIFHIIILLKWIIVVTFVVNISTTKDRFKDIDASHVGCLLHQIGAQGDFIVKNVKKRLLVNPTSIAT